MHYKKFSIILFPLHLAPEKAFLFSPSESGDALQKHTKSGPPAKPGACVIPERASYRQASQEALKKSAACITCPAARKRAPFIQDYLSGNRKVVHLFPLRSMLEAKAFLLSPVLPGDVISLKHTKQQRPRGTITVPRGRGFMLWCLGRGGAFTHRGVRY